MAGVHFGTWVEGGGVSSVDAGMGGEAKAGFEALEPEVGVRGTAMSDILALLVGAG